jgi:tetratricopeptide (TPR) repeat protein
MAQALLSGVYANTGRYADAPEFSRRAFELRDRVSERERFFISWRYYLDATQSWDEAYDLAVSWTMTYPREAFAFNSLGLASAAFGRHDEAVEAFRNAIRLDSRFVPPYGNLAGSLIALNRFAEARSSLQDAAAHGIDFISVRRMAYLLAFIDDDRAAMTRELDLIRTRPEAMWASNWEARTAVFSGRLRAAHERYQEAVRAALRDGFRELAAQWTMEDAEAHAIGGECREGEDEVARGLELGRDNFVLERASRVLALCRGTAELSRLTEELTRRFRGATLTNRLQLPVVSAAAAVASGEFARARDLLEPVRPYDHAPAAEFWPAYLRGLAAMRSGKGQDAATAFQSIVDHRGEAPTSPLFALAHLGLGRAARLAGDTAGAKQGHEAFFRLWKDADPDLGPIAEARGEYARLQ